jgi:hypothetical protein
MTVWALTTRLSGSSFVWKPSFDATAANQPRAAGTLHTRMADYIAFALAVLDEGADEVFRPSASLDDVHGRSLGWGTVRTSAGQLARQHGDNHGFKHMAGLRRCHKDGVLIFTNGDNGQVLCREIFGRVLGAQPW